MNFGTMDRDREWRWYETVGVAILGVATLAATVAILYGAIVAPVIVAGHALAGEWWLAVEDLGLVVGAWLIILLNYTLLGM